MAHGILEGEEGEGADPLGMVARPTPIAEEGGDIRRIGDPLRAPGPCSPPVGVAARDGQHDDRQRTKADPKGRLVVTEDETEH